MPKPGTESEGYDHDTESDEIKASAPEYTEIEALRKSPLAKLLALRQNWKAQEKAAKEQLKMYDGKIGAMLAKAGVEAVRCNEHTLKLHTNSTYTVLTEDALLRNGVAPAVIAASRETKTKQPYLQVYAPRNLQLRIKGEGVFKEGRH